jgi:hypothetical protein
MDEPPPEKGAVARKPRSGNRTERRYRNGRAAGVRNLRTRETDALLAETGLDAPHVALFRIGHDEKQGMPLRVAALAHAAPYFTPKPAPTPASRFLPDALDLGQLTDAASAVMFVASTVECARQGKLDSEWTKLFLDAAATFARLYDTLKLEVEVQRRRELELVDP